MFRVDGRKPIEIGQLKKAESPEELKKISNSEVLKFIMALQGLSSENEAWEYFKTHSKQSDNGLLVLNPDFLVALGVCFKDTGYKAAKGTTLKYQVSYVPKTVGNKPNELVSEITLTGKLASPKPKAIRFSESDSIVNVEWNLPKDESNPALLATIYKREGNYGTFEPIKKLLMANNEKLDKNTISYSEKVKPNTQYDYYAVPTSITGLEGTPSDTISLISHQFGTIPKVVAMSAKDTLSGLYLEWGKGLESDKFISALVLERSTDPKSGYAILDTLSMQQQSYFDTNLLPNVLYHYQLRYLSIRQTLTDQIATASGIHADESLFMEPPVNLKAASSDDEISLSWNKSIFPEVSGYYVYRSKSGQDNWELVSNHLKDTVFKDATIQNGRNTYKYAVKTAGFNGAQSDFSNIVFGNIGSTYKPMAPIGMQLAPINGRVNISWRSLDTDDIANPSFNIYKAIGNILSADISVKQLALNGFQKVNETPITNTSFEDINVVQGKTYSYTITMLDDQGNESPVSNIESISLPMGPLGPPANIGVRKINNEIIISWDKSYQQGVTGYAIYRRSKGNDAYEKVGNVNAQTQEFKDAGLQKGTYFYYVVTAIDRFRESSKSIEVGIGH